MNDPTEERRRSIDADINYITTRFRLQPKGHTVRNRWNTDFTQGGWRMMAPPGSGSSEASVRVSDVERNEVADKLSSHFAEGRLDPAEFKERLDAAMAAKMQGDLSGLFDDLPSLSTERDGQRTPDDDRRRRRSIPVLATIITVVVVLGIASAPLGHWFHVPWFLVSVVAIFFLGRVVAHRHHR